MKLCCVGHTYRYETEKICRLFLPFEKIEVADTVIDGDGVAVTKLDGVNIYCSLSLSGAFCERTEQLDINFDDREAERRICALLFLCLSQITGYKSRWGIVTGIRPARLYASVLKETGSENAAKQYFKDKFYVDEEKISLCSKTYKSEEDIINLSNDNSFSLYISVPFCPTRCSYCSFVSHAVEKAEKLIPVYVDYLCEEIKETAKIAGECNLRLETIYMGGGTPTTLNCQQLERVLSLVRSVFDLSNLREFTVEAGRPDTITKEKLLVLKNCGVDRISINPQTMCDSVLENIGRAHTSQMMVDAFNMAREIGFDNINTDLIAGLPGDTFETFKDTVDKILKLGPESITVHALSLKRSSRMTAKGEFPEIEAGKIADKMVTHAHDILTCNNVLPYYMYRQSKTVGNLENVGYAIKGKECFYNVYIMDETHTILACGASAVTKMRQPRGDYIERIFNFKYPYEYINRFDELMARKEGIKAFYNKYPHSTM